MGIIFFIDAIGLTLVSGFVVAKKFDHIEFSLPFGVLLAFCIWWGIHFGMKWKAWFQNDSEETRTGLISYFRFQYAFTYVALGINCVLLLLYVTRVLSDSYGRNATAHGMQIPSLIVSIFLWRYYRTVSIRFSKQPVM